MSMDVTSLTMVVLALPVTMPGMIIADLARGDRGIWLLAWREAISAQQRGYRCLVEVLTVEFQNGGPGRGDFGADYSGLGA